MTSNNKPIDLRSKRFGRLTVEDNPPDRSRKGYPKWLCKCDCGNERWVYSLYLNNGHTQSCGCLGKESRMKPPGEAGFNYVLRFYRRNAKARCLSWELTNEQVRELTTMDCFYCGKQPSTVSDKGISQNGQYTYNGIDRLDNTVGYVYKNCVPCCQDCNRIKKDFSIDWMKKILMRLGYTIRLDDSI